MSMEHPPVPKEPAPKLSKDQKIDLSIQAAVDESLKNRSVQYPWIVDNINLLPNNKQLILTSCSGPSKPITLCYMDIKKKSKSSNSKVLQLLGLQKEEIIDNDNNDVDWKPLITSNILSSCLDSSEKSTKLTKEQQLIKERKRGKFLFCFFVRLVF